MKQMKSCLAEPAEPAAANVLRVGPWSLSGSGWSRAVVDFRRLELALPMLDRLEKVFQRTGDTRGCGTPEVQATAQQELLRRGIDRERCAVGLAPERVRLQQFAAQRFRGPRGARGEDAIDVKAVTFRVNFQIDPGRPIENQVDAAVHIELQVRRPDLLAVGTEQVPGQRVGVER